jgi:hypothetical protein
MTFGAIAVFVIMSLVSQLRAAERLRGGRLLFPLRRKK